MLDILLTIMLCIVVGLLVLGFIGIRIDSNRRKRIEQRKKLKPLNKWRGTRL